MAISKFLLKGDSYLRHISTRDEKEGRRGGELKFEDFSVDVIRVEIRKKIMKISMRK